MSGHNNHNNPPGLKRIELDQIWGDLKEGIEQLYNRQCMPISRFVELNAYPFQVFCVIDTAYYSFSSSRMVVL